MKKFVLLALMTWFSASTHAAIITYAYMDSIENADVSSDATGLFTVDSVRRGLISAQFESELATFDWIGFSPLMYEQPVASTDGLYENGFQPFQIDALSCFLYLDLFGLAAGEDIFHNLDKTYPNEGASITNLDTGEEFYLIGRLTKVSTVEVPEPSSLALLGLGVLGFVVARGVKLAL